MSTGITIETKPTKKTKGCFQNLAMDFDGVNELLKKDGCDLRPFLFCAANFEDDIEELISSGASEDEIMAFSRKADGEGMEPIASLMEQLKLALKLVKDYKEKAFDSGKEPFIAEIEELLEELAPYEEQNVSVQLVRA